MTDLKFGNGNDNPQFRVVDQYRRFFFSPEIPKGERSNIFQGHHAVSNNIYQGKDFSDFFTKLTAAGYDQSDWKTNQIWLPSNDADAVGATPHSISPANTSMNGTARAVAGAQADDGDKAEAVSNAAQAPTKTDAGTKMALIKTVQAAVGEAVGLLMRDPKYRHLALADLEWLLLPAVTANQMMTMRGKVKDENGQESGLTVPLALALYAKVSKEVDEKLTTQRDAGAPLRLSPSDWTSADIPWLVLASGPKEVMPGLHAKMKETLGAEMRVFTRSADSTTVIGSEPK